MTQHDDQHRQHGSKDWDEDDDQRGMSGQGSSVQDRGEYGGWASGEGQGEFAGDGFSAQGQFSNQRVAQYGDQGYGQDYGREGIGWQNRDEMGPGDDRDSNGQSGSGGQSRRDETKTGTSNS